MKKEDKIKKLEKKKKEIEEQINNLKNNSEWVKIPNTDLEIELNVHHKNKSFDDLKEEFGIDYLNEHLPNLKVVATILENEELTTKLKMNGSSTTDDFYFKQPFKRNEANQYVAYFFAGSVWSFLVCYGALMVVTLTVG